MKRFQMDRPMMAKRRRREWEIHSRKSENFPFGASMGAMRKHRPLERSCSRPCYGCAITQFKARLARRRERYEIRAQALEGRIEWELYRDDIDVTGRICLK